MKISPKNLALLALAPTYLTKTVLADGYEYNADTCAAATRKEPIALANFHLESENLYGPLSPEQYADVPEDCLPANTTSFYGAFYKMEFEGIVGMEIDVHAYTWSGFDAMHSVAIMKGGCGELTCVANLKSVEDLGQQHVDGEVELMANTPYVIFYTLQNIPGTWVPHIEMEAANYEAECKLHRSNELSRIPGVPGVCTPCESSTDGEVTTWTTTCTDPCDTCYNTTNPLYTGEGPFCYTESREWTLKITDSTSTTAVSKQGVSDGGTTRYCYKFADETEVCDSGDGDGACPLVVNGMACSTCQEDFSQPNCAFPNEQYGVFTADCSNLGDGSGVVNKCAGTGFSTPALTNYNIYTDIINNNNAPGGMQLESFPGMMCNVGDEGPPDPFAIGTLAPTPTPNEPIALSLDSRTDKVDVAEKETVQYMIDVSDLTGVISCDTRAESGDVDMYAAVDMPALDPLNTPEGIGCYSGRYDSEEKCELVVEGNTMVYVSVFGYGETTGMQIKCTNKKLDSAHKMKVGVNKKTDTFDLPQNGLRFYKLEAPTDTARIMCTTDSDDGDLDLWMRVGQLPVPFIEYDCQSIALGGDENCELQDSTNTSLASGPDVYILMLGYTNVTGAQLECQEILSNQTTVSKENAEKLDRGKTKSRFDLLENQKRAFYINVPQGSVKVWCDSTQKSSTGKAQLYTNVGDIPVLPGADGTAPDTQCSNGVNGNDLHCEYSWSGGGAPDTQFYAVTLGQDNAPVIGVDINCNAIVPFKQSDAKQITGKKTYNLVAEQDTGYYWDVQAHTGEVKCTIKAKSGDQEIFMSRQWPSVNGGNDCQRTGGGSDKECKYTYGNEGSNKEKMYILIHAESNLDKGEIKCSAQPSQAYKNDLQNQGGDALQNFLNQFATGSTRAMPMGSKYIPGV